MLVLKDANRHHQRLDLGHLPLGQARHVVREPANRFRAFPADRPEPCERWMVRQWRDCPGLAGCSILKTVKLTRSRAKMQADQMWSADGRPCLRSATVVEPRRGEPPWVRRLAESERSTNGRC